MTTKYDPRDLNKLHEINGTIPHLEFAVLHLQREGFIDPAVYAATELSELRTTIAEMREALRPFAHDDLCATLGGNVQGDESPVFARNGAMLKLKHFRQARAILAKYPQKGE